ncbi:dimethylaniline monooxygenase [N-oxide-forming] 5-like [Stegastes partitus]|uniref:Flavin-containing monooxygenase n=1 Tax=Stegastes partitus TaxID=144197 RepID=A0A3B5B0B1_9TELE|nr:PREDICTED: dimethylaniline monooxygenase [N-oxide-forming] 5-like [Stegastes partitus]XP_008275667.1 PREDICTED: dimethylaniline monooxygenase [N-oxide-forming] 5-like [Stegastes partitus]XP_008275668.1 PREDICTED: dimethylaniline monooxygenase [N-oxide-forming] 5-like [Stegastes partitus]
MTRRVAVIGGGSSGLTCIKCCLDEGLEPVCFESSDDIGGLWRFKENPEPDRASIYHSVIINTSKEMMCFSDYPIPAHYPNFMHNSLIMDYFRMYAGHFNLTKHIRFNTKVLQVKQRSDFSRTGQWDVETENKDGKKEKHIFDAVMICIGHHCHPNLPLHDFPGIDTFQGKYFHSRDYKTPEEWRDKKVVVVGIGNSGGDLAVELSRVTKQLYLSTRRGAWVLNRVGENGYPRDLFFNRIMNFLRTILPYGFLCSLGESQLNQRFNHAMYNLKPNHRVFSQHPTVNDELPNRILSGTVQVKPNIRRFQGSSVEFDDGSVVEDVDLVVFATGYRFSFPFLASHVVSVSDNKASLYKYVFPPELERPTVAIIGLVQPLGAIMPISEMQARWATRVFKGCIKLPSAAAMLKDIQYKQDTMAKRYVTSQRHTIQVDYVAYMDEVAELVGVRPNILRMLLTDPRVGLNVMFGPCTPFQYRLRGPGKWAGARQTILTQWERVTRPMQTRPCTEPQPKSSFKWPLLLSTTAVGLAAYINRNNLPAFLQDPAALLDRIKECLPAMVQRS